MASISPTQIPCMRFWMKSASVVGSARRGRPCSARMRKIFSPGMYMMCSSRANCSFDRNFCMATSSDLLALQHQPLAIHSPEAVVQRHGRRAEIPYLEDVLKTNLGMAQHGIALERHRSQLRVEIRRFLQHLLSAVLVRSSPIAGHDVTGMRLGGLLDRNYELLRHAASSTCPHTPPAATSSFSSSSCQSTARSRVGT